MYPEKARWALDHKKLPHVLHSLLPGPHVPKLMWRFGQKGLPILQHGGQTIKGSAAVVDYLEQHYPEPALYPSDPAERQRVLELQVGFDEAGAHVRRAYFQEFLPSTAYAADMFSTGHPPLARRLYRAAFPIIRTIMRQDMKIRPAEVEESRQRTLEAMDVVARERGGKDYLVGDRFSIADLAAAIALHPVALPDEFPVRYPQPLPSGVQGWLERWAKHPTTAWVREIYRRHRGTSSATQDLNG